MIIASAALGLCAAVWTLGAAIMLFGDSCAALCVVVPFLAVLCIALSRFIARNWPSLPRERRSPVTDSR